MLASLNRMSDADSSDALASGASDTSDMSDMQHDSEPATVSGSGVVLAVNAGEFIVNLQHEPIEALGWPAMTMDFAVAPEVDLSQLSVNDKVMFQLEKRDDKYLITSVHAMQGEM